MTQSAVETLIPATWDAFQKKYLDTYYPGHDLPHTERKIKSREWGKSFNTMQAEKLTINNFTRLLEPGWCHVTAEARETFVQKRLARSTTGPRRPYRPRAWMPTCGCCGSLFNVLEEWKHRPKNSNPFAGRAEPLWGHDERAKAKEQESVAGYYTVVQLKNSDQADKEAREAEPKQAWQRHRPRSSTSWPIPGLESTRLSIWSGRTSTGKTGHRPKRPEGHSVQG